MSISGIQSGQNAYEISRTQSSSKATELSASSRAGGDSVTISKEARELSAVAQAGKGTEVFNEEGDLPLEAYSMPDWYGEYVPDACILSPEIDYEYWDLVEEYTADGFLSDDERSKLGSYLDNDPKHQAELEKIAYRQKNRNEIHEYFTLLDGHFRASLEENGINSSQEYYDSVVKDAAGSEKVRQSMAERIENDPRVLELMDILGVSA